MLGLFNLVGSLCVLVGPGPVADAQRIARAQSYTIHVRELTLPERTVLQPMTGSETVLDAVASLQQPALVSHMDLWVVRPRTGGKAQVLRIDWAAITQRNETSTNFQILAGDRLFLQARFAK